MKRKDFIHRYVVGVLTQRSNSDVSILTIAELHNRAMQAATNLHMFSPFEEDLSSTTPLFRVGQVWEDGRGRLETIISTQDTTHPGAPIKTDKGCYYTTEGQCWDLNLECVNPDNKLLDLHRLVGERGSVQDQDRAQARREVVTKPPCKFELGQTWEDGMGNREIILSTGDTTYPGAPILTIPQGSRMGEGKWSYYSPEGRYYHTTLCMLLPDDGTAPQNLKTLVTEDAAPEAEEENIKPETETETESELERNPRLNFKVGQVWKNLFGNNHTIIAIDDTAHPGYPIKSRSRIYGDRHYTTSGIPIPAYSNSDTRLTTLVFDPER